MSLPVTTREQRRQLERENARWPAHLVLVPKLEWLDCGPSNRKEVWRSREFLVQVYVERAGVERLSVNRTSLAQCGKRWEEGITWDELQRLKRECGRGDRDAVEVYPRDGDVVNVANMRHLWVLPELLQFAWRAP